MLALALEDPGCVPKLWFWTPLTSQGTGRWVPEVFPGSRSRHLGVFLVSGGCSRPHAPGACARASNSQQPHTFFQGFQLVNILGVHLQVSRGPEKWFIHATQCFCFIALYLHFDLMWYHRSPIFLICSDTTVTEAFPLGAGFLFESPSTPTQWFCSFSVVHWPCCTSPNQASLASWGTFAGANWLECPEPEPCSVIHFLGSSGRHPATP